MVKLEWGLASALQRRERAATNLVRARASFLGRMGLDAVVRTLGTVFFAWARNIRTDCFAEALRWGVAATVARGSRRVLTAWAVK